MQIASNSRRTFLDTNVLVYTDDSGDLFKQRTAIDLVKLHRRQNSGVVSIQVLQEYFASITKKFKISPESARRKVETLARFHVASPSVEDVLSAIDLHRLQNISFWDSLILRMARQSGCSILLTEDMNHGQVIDGVRIVNPFL
jgi:predicted nucleic acid-binding protein